MKKIITLIIAVLMILPSAVSARAQDRKEERKARRELKRQEKALKDSLMMIMKENELVNIGYGYVKKRKLSTSVSQLDGTESNVTSYSSIADYIQGRIPGVMVQRNGDSVRYIIRGISTNSEYTDPLLLIDGVEVTDFNSIVPSQIESIEVIKDGSASIYGVKGACGVIMVTTKK